MRRGHRRQITEWIPIIVVLLTGMVLAVTAGGR